MLNLLIDSINVQTLTMVSAAIAAIATVLTFAMPMLVGDSLGKRMKAVAVEREKIRARERERMAQVQQKVNLRPSTKQSIQAIVDRFNLKKWVGQEEARLKLVQAVDGEDDQNGEVGDQHRPVEPCQLVNSSERVVEDILNQPFSRRTVYQQSQQ